MNILFLTLIEVSSLTERGIYQDLLRKFRDEGHDVTIVTAVERRKRIATNFTKKEGVSILQVKTFNIQKTNVIEKGIGTLAIEYQYLNAVKKYLKDQKFDLILYSTPPITFGKIISHVKQRDKSYTYLLLKDIFPQNAVDMEMMKKGGFLHRYFTKKEKQLYAISDTIGCMSPANVDFILKHNPEIDRIKLEVNPNTIEPVVFNYSEEQKIITRNKYQLPVDKKIFVYGGNLGKPQGIDFLIETIERTNLEHAFFLIIGDGTEFPKIQKIFSDNKIKNSKLIQKLPKKEYDQLLAACDIGLIFLDKKFTIPNFPSRLLSYLEMKMPILAATDPNTDIGNIIENEGCGYKVAAGNQDEMQAALQKLINEDNLEIMGNKAKQLLQKEYVVDISYNLINKKV